MSETPPGTLVVERLLPHAPDKVWRVLTDSWLLQEWLMDNDFEARVGHRFTVRSSPLPGWTGTTHCEVVRIEAHRQLAYRWGDGTESEEGLKTLVTWTLEERGEGTLLRMEQSGFRPEDGLSHARLGARWRQWLRRLEGLLDRPEISPVKA